MAILSLFFGAGGLAQSRENAPPVLRDIAAVRNLPPEQAARNLPVSLQATVTYYDPSTLSLLVQDSTGAIFVETTAPLPIHPGSIVRVSGVSAPDFTNTITRASVLEIARGRRPIPKAIDIDTLLSGAADCEFVTLTGNVRTAFLAVEQKIPFLELHLEVRGKVVEIQILEFPATLRPDSLVGLTVTMRGVVSGSFNSQHQLEGILVNVQNFDDVRAETEFVDLIGNRYARWRSFLDTVPTRSWGCAFTPAAS